MKCISSHSQEKYDSKCWKSNQEYGSQTSIKSKETMISEERWVLEIGCKNWVYVSIYLAAITRSYKTCTIDKYNVQILMWTLRLFWLVLNSILDSLVKTRKREFLYVKQTLIGIAREIFSSQSDLFIKSRDQQIFSYKRTDSKYFRFFRLQGLCPNHSTLTL